VKSWLTIASLAGRNHYRNTKNAGKPLILAHSRPITPRFPSQIP
jgi:hypothetical protein